MKASQKGGVRMTDRERLYVATIAQCSSITKAAERLFISQPSLTQALRRIETEYGATFFHRGQGGLRLTEEGRAYLDAADKMNRIYQCMEEEIGEASGTQQGRVCLGITAFHGGLLLPDFLSLYRRRFPLMNLKLLESSSTHLEHLASEGRVDIAVLHRPFLEHDLNYISLYREDIYLAVSPEDPDYLAASAAGEKIPCITEELMARRQFNMLMANQRSRQVADRICAAAGIEPSLHFSTSSIATALALTSKGLGATFVPGSYARYYKKQFPTAHFRFPPAWNANWELVAAYAKNLPLSRPCLEAVRVMQECITTMPEVFP